MTPGRLPGFRGHRTSCEERHKSRGQGMETLSSFHWSLAVWPYFLLLCLSVFPTIGQDSYVTYWPPNNVRIRWARRHFLKRSKVTEIKGIIYPAWWLLRRTKPHGSLGNLVFTVFHGWFGTGADTKLKSIVILSQRCSWKKIIGQCEKYYTRKKYKVAEIQKYNIKTSATAIFKPM